jgi:hypothetical protein
MRQVLMAGMNVCLIGHDTEPDPGTKKKGGPKFPSKAIMAQLCADSDGTIMRLMEDEVAALDLTAAPDQVQVKDTGPKRIWRVHGSADWLSKIRGIPDSMYEDVKTMELADILRLSGYAPW